MTVIGKEPRFGKSGMALRLIIAFVTAAILVVGAALPAHAAPDQRTVDRLVIDSRYSTIELVFHGGVSQNEAEEIRASLDAPQRDRGFSTMQDSWPLGCGHSVAHFDSNGRFDIAYNCSGTRSLPWGFRLSAQVQAIVAGAVNERGLRWWRNGSAQLQNAPHIVPPSYQFHGTMLPVSSGDDVDYQDYMTFRHNVGPGGTGSVTFAGSVVLTN